MSSQVGLAKRKSTKHGKKLRELELNLKTLTQLKMAS